MPTVAPPLAIFLAKHPIIDQYDLSKLRWLLSAAAPLDAATQNALASRLGVYVKQGYGMTELSPAATNSPRIAELGVAGSVGQALPGTKRERLTLSARAARLRTHSRALPPATADHDAH